METLIMSGDDAIQSAAHWIKSGEVVAFPTETVYGLGGNALDHNCVSKIFKAKGRPADNPLIVHVAEIEDIYPLVKEFSETNLKIATSFMPGAITLLFPKSDIVPNIVTAGLTNVAIRIPANPVARQFIRACGVPIAAPSANTSTRVSPTAAEHVFDDLKGRIPLIIDGGECEVGIESTVLDLTGEIPTILRPGAVTAEMLLTVLSQVKNHNGEVLSQAPAPGMKYQHYSPAVPFVLASSLQSMLDEYDRKNAEGLRVLALVATCTVPLLGDRKYIDLGDSDELVCRNIYKALRCGEKIADYLICTHFGSEGVCASIMNRLLKASGGTII